jgi:hypothetical protein
MATRILRPPSWLAAYARRGGGPGQRLLEGAAEDGAEHLARVFVELWEDASVRDVLLAIIRSALTQEDAARLVWATFQGLLVRKVARAIGGRGANCA